MQLIPFIADSAADAVGQIRANLGLDAVVVNVRQLPSEGLSRLWQKPKIEVLAYKPEESVPPPSGHAPSATTSPADDLASLRQEVKSMKLRFEEDAPKKEEPGNEWRITPMLESSGLLPIGVEQIRQALVNFYGERPPASLKEELLLVQTALSRMWKKSAGFKASNGIHVMVGPAGAGKTTVLCKWLANLVLSQQRLCRVWRLDSHTANTGEALDIYAEILGLGMERGWKTLPMYADQDVYFVDLPGIDWNSEKQFEELRSMLGERAPVQFHLVLNAAYETRVLMDQIRAFGKLPITDVTLTHLDEEPRWGKVWNLVLGTNYPIRFLNIGQNIPGEFVGASPEAIFSRQFRV